jgi:hypothetical protein
MGVGLCTGHDLDRRVYLAVSALSAGGNQKNTTRKTVVFFIVTRVLFCGGAEARSFERLMADLAE